MFAGTLRVLAPLAAVLALSVGARGGEGEGGAGERPPNPFGPVKSSRPDAVPGKLVLSDGKVYRGKLYLTRDKKLELYQDAEKKWLKLKLKHLAGLKWTVESEKVEKEWRWKESGSDVKVYTGREKTDRRYKTAAVKKDGTKIEGHIRGTVIYVEGADGKKKRFWLYWNHATTFDQKPEDLIYVREALFGAEHAREPAKPKALTPEQVKALAPIIDSLARDLAKLKGKYPEMKAFDPGKARTRDAELYYEHDVQVIPKGYNWGAHGIIIGVTIRAPSGPGQPYPEMRRTELPNLGVRMTYGVQTGKDPSRGLVRELDVIMERYRDKLKVLDQAAKKKGK